MTRPIELSAATLQNYRGIGVPDESLAVILQRGGDELLLSKPSIALPSAPQPLQLQIIGPNQPRHNSSGTSPAAI